MDGDEQEAIVARYGWAQKLAGLDFLKERDLCVVISVCRALVVAFRVAKERREGFLVGEEGGWNEWTTAALLHGVNDRTIGYRNQKRTNNGELDTQRDTWHNLLSELPSLCWPANREA